MPNTLELALSDHFLDFPGGNAMPGDMTFILLVPLDKGIVTPRRNAHRHHV
jgi:hypothetical protein